MDIYCCESYDICYCNHFASRYKRDNIFYQICLKCDYFIIENQNILKCTNCNIKNNGICLNKTCILSAFK